MRRTRLRRSWILVAVAFVATACESGPETSVDRDDPPAVTSSETTASTIGSPERSTDSPAESAPATTLLPPPTGVAELADLRAGDGFRLIERPEWYCGVDGGTHAAMFDPTIGAIEWEIEVPYIGYHEPIVGEGTAWFVGAQQYALQIAAIDLDSGAPRWQWTAGDYIMGVSVVSGTLVVATRTSVDGLDAVTGEPLWRHDATLGRTQVGTSPTRGEFDVRVPERGSMAYVNDNGVVTALDIEDGSVRWTFATVGDFSYSPVLVGDTVFHVSFEGRLYALDATTGAERWSWSSPPGVGITDELAVTGDTVAVATTGLHPDPPADAEQIYALSIADGSPRWQRALSDFDPFTRVVSGTQLLTTTPGSATFTSIDLDTGAVQWSAEFPGSFGNVAGAVSVTDESVMVFAVSAHLGGDEYTYGRRRLSRDTGVLEWVIDGPYYGTVALDAEGLVVLGAVDDEDQTGVVAGLDPISGGEVWAVAVDEQVRTLTTMPDGSVLAIASAPWATCH